MLQSLYINNFVLIDELHLDFYRNLEVFTGETGAGKSIFIDALSLLAGERFHAQYRKNESHPTIIEGVFTSSHHEVNQRLTEAGFDANEELIVTRTISVDGKVKTLLNHRSVSAMFLKETIGALLDIHSQHQTQYLLSKKYHTHLLDQYINQPELILEVKKRYTDYAKLNKEYEAMKNQEGEFDLDYIRFQYEEIEQLHFSIEEFREVEQRVKEMSVFEKHKESLLHVLEILEQKNEILPALYEGYKTMESIPLEQSKKIAGSLQEVYYSLEDLLEQIHSFEQHVHFDEETFQLDQEYLFAVQKVLRKYQNSPTYMLQKYAEFQSQIQSFDSYEDVLASLAIRVDTAFQAYTKAANELRQYREAGAKTLSEQVMEQLGDLYLPHARFTLEFQDSQPSELGNERCEFYCSMNVNQPLQPLKDVASGGELSRLMLGMKVIFSKIQGIETIVFDEIDSGVSGKVAFSIGNKMKFLSKELQVLTITHLASVAAFADEHYLVEKVHQDASTTSNIRLLNNDERIHELVMLSGHSFSEHAKQSALELLSKAKSIHS